MRRLGFSLVTGDPTPGRVLVGARSAVRRRLIVGRRRLCGLLLASLAAVCVLAATAGADSRISAKRAQAQSVLAQIQVIQSRVEQAGNAYYAATSQLRDITGTLRLNTSRLSTARQGLDVARARVAARLRSLYMSGTSGGTLEVILGAESLDDLQSRLDAEKRVARQDVEILRELRSFHTEVASTERRLSRERSAQAKLVAERAAERRAIGNQLAEQQSLLASIRDEIAKLRAEEARRQALLAAQARARYLAALQAQREQAAHATTGLPSSIGLPGGFPNTAPPPPSRYGNVVAIALQYLGTPYVWGASGPGAFDCSGFTAYVYAQVGVYLPHNAAAQYAYGVPVSRDQLEPGDLVFFDQLGHVGLYIGNNEFVQAPQTGDVVKITSMNDPWVMAYYYGARRIL